MLRQALNAQSAIKYHRGDNEAERRQNAHAVKTCLRVAMAHAGVSRIRSASGEYREAASLLTLIPNPYNLAPDP